MRILFNVMNCGLGNNGGSATIVKSANTLQELGHDVIILDTGINHHTWTPLLATQRKIRNDNEVPDADVVIATGFNTVASTLKLADRCGMKFHYIRGWETWTMSEEDIVNRVLNVPTNKIVNSIGLQNKLNQYQIKSKVLYPGYEIEDLYPLFKRDDNKDIIIGGLNAAKKHWGTKRTDWIFEAATRIKKVIPYVKLWMMGNDKKPRIDVIDNYCRQPNMVEKNEFYNSIDLWLSPSCLEGLHIPPAEAMLTKCPVLGVKAELSGTQDYLHNGKTGLLSKNNLDTFCSLAQNMITDKGLRKDFGEKGYNTVKEIGDRKYNMQLMVEYFKEMLS